jgi:hypothetical protein
VSRTEPGGCPLKPASITSSATASVATPRLGLPPRPGVPCRNVHSAACGWHGRPGRVRPRRASRGRGPRPRARPAPKHTVEAQDLSRESWKPTTTPPTTALQPVALPSAWFSSGCCDDHRSKHHVGWVAHEVGNALDVSRLQISHRHERFASGLQHGDHIRSYFR